MNFKGVYVPMNASSVAHAAGNSLRRTRRPWRWIAMIRDSPIPPATIAFRLNASKRRQLQTAQCAQDQKDGATVETSAGGNLRMNIPSTTDNSVTEKLILLNHLDQPLTDVQITVGDTAHFQVMNTPSPRPRRSRPCRPGGGRTRKGRVLCPLHQAGGYEVGIFPTTLQVKFIPDGSGVQNTFTVNLTGTVNHQVIQGEADMKIEFIASYIDTPASRFVARWIPSIIEGPELAVFKPGAMRMQFNPISGSETKRSVTIVNIPGLEPTAPNILNNLRALGKSGAGQIGAGLQYAAFRISPAAWKTAAMMVSPIAPIRNPSMWITKRGAVPSSTTSLRPNPANPERLTMRPGRSSFPISTSGF